MNMISVILPDNMKAQVIKFAKEHDLTISQVIRMALRKFLGGE